MLHNISEKRRFHICRLTVQSLVFNIYMFTPILSTHCHKTGLNIIVHSSHLPRFPLRNSDCISYLYYLSQTPAHLSLLTFSHLITLGDA